MIEIIQQKKSAKSVALGCVNKLTMMKEMAGIMGDCCSGCGGRIENIDGFLYGLESICGDMSDQLNEVIDYIPDDELSDTAKQGPETAEV
jgi:hypothetical protein